MPFNVGPTELGIIAFLALLFFGKDKLPNFAKDVGKSMREFRNALSDNEESVNNSTKITSVKLEEPKTEAAKV